MLSIVMAIVAVLLRDPCMSLESREHEHQPRNSDCKFLATPTIFSIFLMSDNKSIIVSAIAAIIGFKQPVTPSSIISVCPPDLLAMTGVDKSMASIKVLP